MSPFTSSDTNSNQTQDHFAPGHGATTLWHPPRCTRYEWIVFHWLKVVRIATEDKSITMIFRMMCHSFGVLPTPLDPHQSPREVQSKAGVPAHSGDATTGMPTSWYLNEAKKAVQTIGEKQPLQVSSIFWDWENIYLMYMHVYIYDHICIHICIYIFYIYIWLYICTWAYDIPWCL